MFIVLRTLTLCLMLLSMLVACANPPKPSKSINTKHLEQNKITKTTNKGQKIAKLAESLLGAPYKYGGASPKGFDCSGLVYYTHGKFGIRTPRTSLQQYKHAKNIKLSKLNSG